MTDIAAIIVFHEEGLLAPASIASFSKCCDHAVDAGLIVQRVAMLDRPDQATSDLVMAHRDAFDVVETVDHADLGPTRNAGREASDAAYVAFFDGDDLWGEEWLHRAHVMAATFPRNDAILHPHVIYYFTADDYLAQSLTSAPSGAAKSYFMIEPDSRQPRFDGRTLVFSNLWTANSFAPRETYERYPFTAVQQESGFGVEDWTWNMQTLAAGLDHVVVPETVHCVRMKRDGSLGLQNTRSGLLPSIHRYAARLEDV